MGTSITRQEKIRYMRVTLERELKKKKSVNVDKFLANFCVIFSSTLRTAKEILNLLVKMGDFKLEDGLIINK